MIARQLFSTVSSFVLALALMPGMAAADSRPAACDLGTLGGNTSFARSINARGDVVGTAEVANGTNHGFLWRNGSMVDLGTLGGVFSSANDVNNQGVIVGVSSTPGEMLNRAVVWSQGIITELPPLNGAVYSEAVAINERGEIVGSSGGVPVLWTGGSVVALASSGYARDINARGDVVLTTAAGPAGEARAFLWRDGTLVDLGTLGNVSSAATGINARGEVVGVSENGSGAGRGFIWRGGVMTELAALGDFAAARGISDSGLIVGEGFTSSGLRALLWGRDGEIRTLPGLPGSDFSVSYAVNNRGDVAGASFSGTGFHAVRWSASGSCR